MAGERDGRLKPLGPRPNLAAMKVSDATILALPGTAPLDDAHWIGRWTRRLSTALPVPAGTNGDDPLPGLIDGAPGPVVVLAYREGIERLVSHADAHPVRAAFMVGPRGGTAMEERVDPLPFPSILVASRDDPRCPFDRAEMMGARWGSLFVDAGEAGELGTASGRGPWPEGLLTFARFLSNLPVEA